MKKITSLMLGMTLAAGTFAFAQDAPKSDDSGKMDSGKMDKKSKKKKKKDKMDNSGGAMGSDTAPKQ